MKGNIGFGRRAEFIPVLLVVGFLNSLVVEMNLGRRIPLVYRGPVGDSGEFRGEIGIIYRWIERQKAGQMKLRLAQLVLIFRVIVGKLDDIFGSTGQNRL